MKQDKNGIKNVNLLSNFDKDQRNIDLEFTKIVQVDAI